MAARARAQQPQYDLLTGEPITTTLRETARPTVAVVDGDLRAQIHRLQYEIESLKQDRDLATLRHDEDLRNAQTRADADHRRAQDSESSSRTAAAKLESLAQQFDEFKQAAEIQQSELEKKLRLAQEEGRTAQEEAEDLRTELVTQGRQLKHDVSDLQAKLDAASRAAQDFEVSRDSKAQALQSLQQELAERDVRIGALESELVSLKTQSNDSDAMAVVKAQLSDQVTHIQKLEADNTDYQIELTRLRKDHKSIAVAEEQKRQLENKITALRGIQKELDEARLQTQILHDEKKAWLSYLEGLDYDDEELRIESPEDLAKAYMAERMERASLVDQLGRVAPDLATKEEQIQSLETQLNKLREESTKAQSGGTLGTDAKAVQRLERQSKLAQKEVDYLRAQLKAYDDEQSEFTPEKHDALKTSRITDLESAVDEHRKEIQLLQAELSKAEKLDPNTIKSTGSKRSREDDDADDQRLSDLRRKNKAMQADLEKLMTSRKILKKELEASRTQIQTLKSSSQRVLELRDNPTARNQAIKQHTLDTLRAENAALLAQLEKRDADQAMVPQATLERLRADIADRDRALAEKDKFMKRHRDVFASKSIEFRQAVASLLGWDLNIMPNGRVRVASIFYSGKNEDEDDDEPPGSIVFDGEKQTMKVSGGPKSAFAREIQDQIKFWVDGRNEIPCFLAACTLEFYDRSTRAQKI